jgi:hypothetical protein
VLGRHGNVVVDSRGGGHQQTFRAIARNDHLSVASAFKNTLETIQPQTAARFHLAVTSDAGGIEERLDIFVKRHAGLRSGGRQFGNIHFADVPMVYLLLRHK